LPFLAQRPQCHPFKNRSCFFLLPM
jgi:hypothetical protein